MPAAWYWPALRGSCSQTARGKKLESWDGPCCHLAYGFAAEEARVGSAREVPQARTRQAKSSGTGFIRIPALARAPLYVHLCPSANSSNAEMQEFLFRPAAIVILEAGRLMASGPHLLRSTLAQANCLKSPRFGISSGDGPVPPTDQVCAQTHSFLPAGVTAACAQFD